MILFLVCVTFSGTSNVIPSIPNPPDPHYVYSRCTLHETLKEAAVAELVLVPLAIVVGLEVSGSPTDHTDPPMLEQADPLGENTSEEGIEEKNNVHAPR